MASTLPKDNASEVDAINSLSFRGYIDSARQLCEVFFVIYTLIGFCHAIYTVPPGRWSSLAIFIFLSTHTIATLRLRTYWNGDNGLAAAFYLMVALTILTFGDMSFLNLGKLALYFATAYFMALVSLGLRSVKAEMG